MTNKAPNKDEGWAGLIKTMLIAFFCAAIFRSFLYEPFHIPSSSMEPNLLIGDYIFVSKFSYGYSRYSFPLGLDIFSGRVFDSPKKAPQRGDAMVFRLPSNPKINYIKRLIGLPGDEIKMVGGHLMINEQEVEKVADGSFVGGSGVAIKKFIETLPNDQKVTVLDQFDDNIADNTGAYIVPEGHYFVMGDNRDNSQDSRFLGAVGYIPAENLVGKAQIIFFSSSKPFWQFWHWPKSIRWERLLKVL
jgi:signal peptidase I